MSECTCHKNYTEDVLIPQVGVITDIRQETPDVKTFRVNALEGGKLFEHMPGQCAMLLSLIHIFRVCRALSERCETRKTDRCSKTAGDSSAWTELSDRR